MRLSRRRRGDAGREAGRRPEPIHFKVGTTPAEVVVMYWISLWVEDRGALEKGRNPNEKGLARRNCAGAIDAALQRTTRGPLNLQSHEDRRRS